MGVLHTLASCCADAAERLTRALDKCAQNPETDLFDTLFGGLPHYIPTQ